MDVSFKTSTEKPIENIVVIIPFCISVEGAQYRAPNLLITIAGNGPGNVSVVPDSLTEIAFVSQPWRGATTSNLAFGWVNLSIF